MARIEDLQKLYEVLNAPNGKKAKSPNEWLAECAHRFSEVVGVEVKIDETGNFIPIDSSIILDPALLNLESVKGIKVLVESVRREAGLNGEFKDKRK